MTRMRTRVRRDAVRPLPTPRQARPIMRFVRHAALAAACAVLALLLAPRGAWAVRDDTVIDRDDPRGGDPIQVEVWTDRGTGAVYHSGEALGVFVRVSRTSYVALYDIDTRGDTHVLYPRDPLDERLLRAGRTYRFPLTHHGDYLVDGPPGIEYLEAIASPDPLYVRLPWNEDGAQSVSSADEDDDTTWLYHVAGDPFAWCARVNRLVLADDPYSGNGYASFYVERQVAYPRFLCNECHAHPWGGFDPYYSSCPVFEVRFTVGWVYRSSPYRYRTCDPYYVYYRRDNCPPRWSSLPRYWSSADRHRIHEYFSGVRELRGPHDGAPGGTAGDKDRDTRAKPPEHWTRHVWPGDARNGGGSAPSGGSPGIWKDTDDHRQKYVETPRDIERGAHSGGVPSGDGESGGDVGRNHPPVQPAEPPRRSWIQNLLRGTGGGSSPPPEREREHGRQESGHERQASPPPPPPPAPRPEPKGSGNASGKDGDHRSK